jgi:hypothetical protein
VIHLLIIIVIDVLKDLVEKDVRIDILVHGQDLTQKRINLNILKIDQDHVQGTNIDHRIDLKNQVQETENVISVQEADEI